MVATYHHRHFGMRGVRMQLSAAGLLLQLEDRRSCCRYALVPPTGLQPAAMSLLQNVCESDICTAILSLEQQLH